MGGTKGDFVALTTISILTILAGIAVFVLFKFTFDAGVDFYGAPRINTFWPYGIPVLIAGILGMIAAIVKNRISIVFYVIFGITCLLTFGALIGIAGYIFFYTANMDSSTCYYSPLIQLCICEFREDIASRLSLKPCDAPVIGLSQASCAVMVITWFLMLAGLITSCITLRRPDIRNGHVDSTTMGDKSRHEMQPRSVPRYM